jgi:two-component system, cell cycle sensor histidine kinase and response regulator CckA
MPKRTPLILIVEDEEHVGKIAALFLAEAGFQVRYVRTVHEALRFWDLLKNDIDLVLTDWVMPDLFGDQLVARFLEDKPGLKVLFMSGNPIASLETQFKLEEGVNFLQKPFIFESLVPVVRKALGLPPENL